MLTLLAGALGQSGHSAAADAEKLLHRGQEITEGLSRGGKPPVERDQVREYLTSISRLLEAISTSAQPSPKREKFWTQLPAVLQPKMASRRMKKDEEVKKVKRSRRHRT